jgi:hypothetical protein
MGVEGITTAAECNSSGFNNSNVQNARYKKEVPNKSPNAVK